MSWIITNKRTTTKLYNKVHGLLKTKNWNMPNYITCGPTLSLATFVISSHTATHVF